MHFEIITLGNDNVNKTNHGYDLPWTPKKWNKYLFFTDHLLINKQNDIYSKIVEKLDKSSVEKNDMW